VNVWLTSDWHLNHDNIATYCDRPRNFTSTIIKRHNERVRDEDIVVCLGDVAIGKRQLIEFQVRSLRGRKILVRGNHDKRGSNHWWMSHGFDFACDGVKFGNYWLTHIPSTSLADGCVLNIHGHLHNIWGKPIPAENQKGMVVHNKLRYPWQRLFAIEYTNYYPIEIEEFVAHPEKYQAIGPKEGTSVGP
jgi:calcineurin-like phosphoesterase family protein